MICIFYTFLQKIGCFLNVKLLCFMYYKTNKSLIIMNTYPIVEHLGQDCLLLDSSGDDLLLGLQSGTHVRAKKRLVRAVANLNNKRYLEAYNKTFGTTWRCHPPKLGNECNSSWWYWEPEMDKPCMAIVKVDARGTVIAKSVLFSAPFKVSPVKRLSGYWMQIRCEVLCA